MLVQLGYYFLRFLYLTQRWTVISEDNIEDNWFNNKPHILTFWHNRQLGAPIIYTTYNKNTDGRLHVLISPHKDGRLIANIIQKFGIKSVAGSSSQKAIEATRGLIKLLKSGNSIVITPDGPRGPNQKVKDGIINIARITKTPVVPASYVCKRVKIFNSWDKMMLPLPFTKGVMYLGKTLYSPSNEELENALNQAEIEAKKLL